MPGGPDGAQVPARQVDLDVVFQQDVGLGHRDQRADLHRGVGQVGPLVLGHPRDGQEVQHPFDQLVCLDVAALQQGGIGRVEADPGPRGLPHPSGQPVVVGVDVGHHHRPHVGHRAAGRPQAVIEGLPGVVGVPACVDQGHPVVELEGVDQDVAQRVVRDGHRDRPEARAHLLDRREHVAVPGLLLEGAGHSEHRCTVLRALRREHTTWPLARRGPRGPSPWAVGLPGGRSG